MTPTSKHRQEIQRGSKAVPVCGKSFLERRLTEYLCQLNLDLFFSLMKKHCPALFSQVLAYTLSCVCTAAFSAGIIEAAEAEDTMNKLRLLVESNQQVGRRPDSFPLWGSGRCSALMETHSD